MLTDRFWLNFDVIKGVCERAVNFAEAGLGRKTLIKGLGQLAKENMKKAGIPNARKGCVGYPLFARRQ